MKIFFLINIFLFVSSFVGILLDFSLYPVVLLCLNIINRKKNFSSSNIHPSVSFIIIVRNSEELIVDKIQNSLSLKYPSENYEIVIFSDGSTDETNNLIRPFINKKVKFLFSSEHLGKSSGLNQAVKACSGEIIVFSDVDAILEPDTILNLVKHFADDSVGGVCGERVIKEKNIKLTKAQSAYIKFDSMIKNLESKIGSMSSNDGKLYAIRKDLFRPIPPAVTDDLYVCLSVVKKNRRFVFEPSAKAYIKVPSRSGIHEIKRRRRIVSRSLRNIFLNRELLNPFKYGFFSVSLMINKVIRRLIPVFLILILLTSIFLSFYSPIIKIFLFLQIAFYIFVLSYYILFQHIRQITIVTKVASIAYYFWVGNFGTLLGLIDFLMGKKLDKWEPIKTD